MDRVQVGVAEKGSAGSTDLGPSVQGILGIAFEFSETAVSNGGPEYTNVVGSFVKNRLIKTPAYSMYLDDQGIFVPP